MEVVTMNLINWLRDVSVWDHPQTGARTYIGECPFDVVKSKQEDVDALLKRPWVISHESAADKLWRVTGYESFAIPFIRKGQKIGLIVEEWKEAT
jgi:hypothetical protein